MLIRVVTTNFRSYGQETEFNMLPSSNVRKKEWHIHSQGRGANVLRTAVIYGANGAGKSCLIKALDRLQSMVDTGYLPSTAFRDANKYIDVETPVTIEVEFGTETDQYSYGVSYRGTRCVEEWLYSTIKKPVCVFERKYDAQTGKTNIKLTASSKRDEDKNKLLVSLLEDNLLKDNELLLSKRDVVKNAQMIDAFQWLTTKLYVIFPESRSTSIFDNRYSDETFKSQSEALLSALDLGINELTLKDEDIESFKRDFSEWPNLVQFVDRIVNKLSRSPQGTSGVIDTSAFTGSMRLENNKCFVRRVQTLHRVNDSPYDFELKEESDGTQRIFDFVPMVQDVKNEACTYVIDELDRSLHPILVRALVSRIVGDKNMKGQLIFTTHDAGLLDGNVFRNDEIWFAEKDRDTQSTHLYTLDEFKPRADLNLAKGYLNGRFGAIPFLARLDELSWE